MTRIEIVIPCAGEGKRFQEAGYSTSKPFIDVAGKPMIVRVIENLRPVSDCFTLICRSSQVEKLEKITGALNLEIRCIPVPGLTDGSTSTCLVARDKIAPEVPVIIANADQLIEYDAPAWWESVRAHRGHAIWLFGPANHSKWSYAKVEGGEVTQVAEKRPISQLATCGVYFFRRWDAYVWAADSMIAKDIRVNGEFYNCPVYNELLERGDKVYPFYPRKMYGLGTPEDLKDYLCRLNQDRQIK